MANIILDKKTNLDKISVISNNGSSYYAKIFKISKICVPFVLVISMLSGSLKTSHYDGKTIDTTSFSVTQYFENPENFEYNQKMQDAINKNTNMNAYEKGILLQFQKMINDIEYINEPNFSKVETLKVIYQECDTELAGDYIEKENIVDIYNGNIDALSHEFIHSIATYNDKSFFNEGMTCLLDREYFNKQTSSERYNKNVNLIKTLIEIYDSNTISKIFFDNDIELFKSILGENEEFINLAEYNFYLQNTTQENIDDQIIGLVKKMYDSKYGKDTYEKDLLVQIYMNNYINGSSFNIIGNYYNEATNEFTVEVKTKDTMSKLVINEENRFAGEAITDLDSYIENSSLCESREYI